MNRLIDAYALLAELNRTRFPGAPYVDAGISIAIGKVCDAPTIDPEPKWIPVSERLPKPNALEGKVRKYYLVQNKFGDMMVACFVGTSNGKTWWEQMYAHAPIKDDIVAWMPLPEPYKEGEQDEKSL